MKSTRSKKAPIRFGDWEVLSSKDFFFIMVVEIPYLAKSKEACITIPSSSCMTDYGVILTHGAGGDMHLQQLKLLADYLGEKGMMVVRFTCKGLNLAYRVKVYTHVLEHVCAEYKDVKRFFLAGRSMGSRAAVITANNSKGTEFEYNVAGVIALSYPLHTKENKSNLRDGPLYDMEKPVCFISGTRDEMCEQKLLKAVLEKVPDHVIKWIDGADHALKVKGYKEEDVVDEIGQFVVDWCSSLSGKVDVIQSIPRLDDKVKIKSNEESVQKVSMKNAKRNSNDEVENKERKQKRTKRKK